MTEMSIADRCRFLADQGVPYAEVARRLGISRARAYSAIHVSKSGRMGRPRKPRCPTCDSKFCCHAHEGSTDDVRDA